MKMNGNYGQHLHRIMVQAMVQTVAWGAQASGRDSDDCFPVDASVTCCLYLASAVGTHSRGESPFCCHIWINIMSGRWRFPVLRYPLVPFCCCFYFCFLFIWVQQVTILLYPQECFSDVLCLRSQVKRKRANAIPTGFLMIGKLFPPADVSINQYHKLCQVIR